MPITGSTSSSRSHSDPRPAAPLGGRSGGAANEAEPTWLFEGSTPSGQPLRRRSRRFRPLVAVPRADVPAGGDQEDSAAKAAEPTFRTLKVTVLGLRAGPRRR